MFSLSRKKPAPTAKPPQLELSGPVLVEALEMISSGCDLSGGIDRFVLALKLRRGVFVDMLVEQEDGPLTPDHLAALAMFMPTVRRRIGPYLEGTNFELLRNGISVLLAEKHDVATADARILRFCDLFPNDKAHRWVRDLAAEILHAVEPERYPLMCRWVWDVKSNTGVLREIWHGDIDSETLKVGDEYLTFLTLREELSQFLSSHGIVQEVQAYVDLLCAQIYAVYISAQGGSYLRADFSSAEDPMAHVRRLLGLDGVQPKINRDVASSASGAAETLALIEGAKGP